MQRPRGLSLIELLVALTMSTILIAGSYHLFTGHQHTYYVQEQVTDMQQNLRAAMDCMAREIRMAGFGKVDPVLPVTFPGGTFNNIVNPAGASQVSHSITIVMATIPKVDETPTLKEVLANNKIRLSLASEFNDTTRRYVSIGGVESHQIEVDGVKDDTITLSDNLLFKHNPGTPVYAVRAITYRIETGRDGISRLRRIDNISTTANSPVADNIETLDFEYFDDKGNPIADPIARAGKIRMIRVRASARTDEPDPAYQGGAGPAGPEYRQREAATYVQIRNLNLSP